MAIDIEEKKEKLKRIATRKLIARIEKMVAL